MSTWDELSANYLKAALLDPRNPTTFTVVKVEPAVLDNGSKKRRMPLLFFKEEGTLPLALNSTNRQCMAAMFGPEAEAAVNKRVAFYVGQDRDPSTGKMGPCVRIWGSPDIAQDIHFEVKLPKKRPVPTTLHRTCGRPSAPTGRSTSEAPPPARSTPTAAPLTEAEVLDLQARINAANDPAEVADLRAEVNGPLKGRLGPAAAVIRAAFEAADERCGGPPP